MADGDLLNHDDLVERIESWLARPDLKEDIPTFIRLAELRYERETLQRHRWTESETTGLAMVAGDDFIPMPAGATEIRWIRINTKPIARVGIVTPEVFDNLREQDSGGVPKGMMMRGLEIALAPTPNGAHDYDILFYEGITTPLNATNPTNWLMTNAPDLYLYGALLEAYLFLEDDTAAAKWDAYFTRARKSLDRVEARARTGGGRLAVRPDVIPGSAGGHVPSRSGP